MNLLCRFLISYHYFSQGRSTWHFGASCLARVDISMQYHRSASRKCPRVQDPLHIARFNLSPFLPDSSEIHSKEQDTKTPPRIPISSHELASKDGQSSGQVGSQGPIVSSRVCLLLIQLPLKLDLLCGKAHSYLFPNQSHIHSFLNSRWRLWDLPSTEISWMAKRRMMVQIIPSVILTFPSTISAGKKQNHYVMCANPSGSLTKETQGALSFTDLRAGLPSDECFQQGKVPKLNLYSLAGSPQTPLIYLNPTMELLSRGWQYNSLYTWESYIGIW